MNFQPASIPTPARDDAPPPRSRGAAGLTVRLQKEGTTRISDLRQAGALKLVFPRTHRPDLEAVCVNTGGGITGGDAFRLTATVGAGAALTLTTQAAERAYKAQPGETGSVATVIDVGQNARLHWLPQEMILFDGAALHRRLQIRLAPSATLLMVEPVVFGRAAMGEVVRRLRFRDRIKITRDGAPLYHDGLDLSGDVHDLLARPAIAMGACAMVSLVLVSPDAARHLQAVRALLPPTGGASLRSPDVLTLRLVAADSFEMRRSLVPILDHLTDHQLPLSWRL